MKSVLTGMLTSVVFGASVLAQAPELAAPRAQQHQTAATRRSSNNASEGAIDLGMVRLTRRVLADGQPLAAGTYDIRVTTADARPVAGETPGRERWAEFLQKGKVKGREVVTIVPATEIKQIARETPPRPGKYRVDLLAGNKYVRIWVNRGGNHYLLHLPPA